MDLTILAALSNRAAYDKYSRFVKTTSLGEDAHTLFLAFGEWFKIHPKSDNINWKSFGAWYSMIVASKMQKEKLKVHKELIKILATEEVIDDDVTALLHGLTKRDFASQIGDLALRISDGEKGDFSQIEDLLSDYNAAVGRLDRLEGAVGSFSLEDLRESRGPGLEWRLKALNEGYGDLRKGDLVVFGKRPDSGGTTFLASEATWMAEQLKENEQVLWVNNEERGSKVRSRIVQSAVGWEREKFEAEDEAAMREFFARMGREDRIVVFDKSDATAHDVDRLVGKHNFGLILVDQGWKMKGFNNDNEAQRQTRIANWLRELSKSIAPVIAVYQASTEAEGKRWINQAQLYFSGTGVQGEADLIITLGRDFTSGNSRFLWLPKNKSQTPRNQSMRNGRWEIVLEADRARFREPFYE